MPTLAIGAAGAVAGCHTTGAVDEVNTSAEVALSRSSFPAFVVSTYFGGSLGMDNDQECIQSTLNAANSAGGGLVVLPPRSDGYVYKYEQLVMPRWVRLSGVAWHTFGANGSVARLQQLTGVNDDSIIFSDNDDSATTRPWVGPFGITDVVLRGASGATAGHAISFRVPDGRIGLMQDASTVERVVVRGFAGSGVFNRGGSPVYFNDIAVSNCGRYGVEIEDTHVDMLAGSIHHLVMSRISGDANMGGVADGGGATVYLKGLQAKKTAVLLLGVKSEYRIRLESDSGDGTVMGNFHALIADDCACPITVSGIEHIATGSQTRKPGNAIQVRGLHRPDLLWQSVTVRDDHPSQVVGAPPYRVFDEVLGRGSAAPHGALGPSIESYEPDQLATQIDTERRDELTTGEGTLARRAVTDTVATLFTGTIWLTYFTARKTEAVTQVRTCSGSTAASEATLCRIGVYEVDNLGKLTLIASTANDTSLWSATSTTYASPFTSSFLKRRGITYAVGALVVEAGTAPDLLGQAQMLQDEASQPPRLCGAINDQTDLPTEVAPEAVGFSMIQVYAALVP